MSKKKKQKKFKVDKKAVKSLSKLLANRSSKKKATKNWKLNDFDSFAEEFEKAKSKGEFKDTCECKCEENVVFDEQPCVTVSGKQPNFISANITEDEANTLIKAVALITLSPEYSEKVKGAIDSYCDEIISDNAAETKANAE